MRWPFMLRRTHERLVADGHTSVGGLSVPGLAQHAAAEPLAGADGPKRLTLPERVQAQRDPIRRLVTDTIRREARRADGSIDARLVSYLRDQASKLRAQKLSEEDIAAQIATWQTSEDTGPAWVARAIEQDAS